MLGFRKKSSDKVSTLITTSYTEPTAPVKSVKVKSYLGGSTLHYTDHSNDFSFYPWVEENIEDTDVDPIVSSVNSAVVSYESSIQAVLTTIKQDTLPEDFIPDRSTGSSMVDQKNNLEVTIL